MGLLGAVSLGTFASAHEARPADSALLWVRRVKVFASVDRLEVGRSATPDACNGETYEDDQTDRPDRDYHPLHAAEVSNCRIAVSRHEPTV